VSAALDILPAQYDICVPLQPKQRQLYGLIENSPATVIGYGGSRGGAKSHGLRATMLLRRLKYDGTRGLIFRRKYKQLWANHVQPLFEQYPFMREWYNTEHRELTLPNGSVIVFGYAEHHNDIYDFQGEQYMDIGVDEATQMTEAELVFLKTCNRHPGIAESQCKMTLTMNPGGRGHAYVKRIFFDHDYHENERAGDYAFLQAYAWDNVGWSYAVDAATGKASGPLADDGLTPRDYYSWSDEQRYGYFIARTGYGRKLLSLPAALRNGHLMGRWDIFAGQYFDIFDPARHTARVEQLGQAGGKWEAWKMQPWHVRWISIDWGFDHPSAVYWHTSPAHNKTVTYREFVQDHLAQRELAQAIAERSQGEQIRAIYLSPDAFGKRTEADTIAQQIGDALAAAGLPRPQMADDDRVGGWMLMYQLMQAGEWLITDNCTELIMCLPTLTRHETKVEDVCKVDGDDAADAARYGLKSHLRGHVGTPPHGVRVVEAVAVAKQKYPDMTPTDFYMIAEAAESKLHRAQNFRRGSRFAKWMKH
jgi:hypothetical protein